MPHIIMEMTRNLADSIDHESLLRDLHTTLAAEKDIEEDRIKSRTYISDTSIIGIIGKQGKMLHVTVLLLSGRDNQTRQLYGQRLHAIARTYVPAECSLTLEVRDMLKDSYIL